MTPVNSPGIPSKHGWMETFNKDVDVTNDDKPQGTIPGIEQAVHKDVLNEEEELYWLAQEQSIDTCFPSTLPLSP